MCTIGNAELIRDVVTSRVNNHEMFSAFEISLAVQELARDRHEPVERHREMRGEIHRQLQEYLDNGLYSRRLCDVGADEPAFVYYPQGGNPDAYVPLKRRDAGGPNPNIVATVTALSSPALPGPTTGTPLTVGRHSDARGTLCVPSNLLRDCGFGPRQAAVIWAVPGVTEPTLAVGKESPAGVQPITTYTVDDNINVRITAPTLASSGLPAYSMNQVPIGYEFEKVGDAVYVTSV